MPARSLIFLILALGCLAGAADAWAETAAVPDAPRMDFSQALTAARNANKQYLVAVEAEKATHARWWQAALMMGPSATAQFGYLLNAEPMVSSMEMNGMPIFIQMNPNYHSGQLAVSQPLFAGFKLSNNLRLAGLQHQNAQADLALAESQLYVNVTEAYYGVIVAQELLKVTENLLLQSQDHLAVVQARYREGSASNYDLLRSEVQLANLKPALLQARNGLSLARSRLALAIGRPVEALGNLVPDMPIAEAALPAQADLVAQALDKRQELQNQDRVKAMAEIGHTLAATGNLPALALNGSLTFYDSQDQAFPPRSENILTSWQIMLGLSWPFWDNLSVFPKMAEASAKIKQAELSRQALADAIRLEVEAHYLNLIAARELLAAQQKTIEQAELGYKIASQQYTHGMMTNIDVMDAQLALNQAKTNYLQTQYNCVMAAVKLKKAIGERFP